MDGYSTPIMPATELDENHELFFIAFNQPSFSTVVSTRAGLTLPCGKEREWTYSFKGPEMSAMEKVNSGSRVWIFARNTVIFILACGAGAVHYWHASSMFENDRNFSRIAPIQREISLRTEMGFYYSFYKTVVEERHLPGGIAKLLYDRLVEYPDEVNAINRFNIYPEITTGVLYHYAAPWLQRWRSRLAEPIFFYLEGVWCCAAATLSALFLSAVVLCGNVVGGVVAVSHYLWNHAECTRVMWAPNERENYAQPFLLAQMALLTIQLRRPVGHANNFSLQSLILFLNGICLLSWQFSQFILLTQLAIVFLMEQLRIINTGKLCLLLHSHFCGLHMAVMFTQGNDMLLTSVYSSFFAVVAIYAMLLSSLKLKQIETKTDLAIESCLVLLRIGIVLSSCFWLKKVASDFLNVEEDSHIMDIMYSKFTDYKTFHTMLYTCSQVFSFLPPSYFWKVTQTGLLPTVGFGISNVLYYWMFVSRKEPKAIETETKKIERTVKTEESAEDSGIENVFEKIRKKKRRKIVKSQKEGKNDSDESTVKDDEKNVEIMNKETVSTGKDETNSEVNDSDAKVKRNKLDKWVRFLNGMDVDPGVFYNISQMFVFGCMAIIIMRLKLLFTPHMCIVASLAAKPGYYNKFLRRHKKIMSCVAIGLVSIAAYHGYQNFVLERSFIGEFYDGPLEDLLTWISEQTGRSAVFAGPMPLTASVLLSTRRAIVQHPHYEHNTTRQRTYAVYKTYGRFTPSELYAELTRLKVTYLLLEMQYCYGKSRLGCTFGEIWDRETPALRDRPKLCHRLLTEELPHFYKVYLNERYAVFRVHDYSVLYTPRSYDT